MDGPEKPSGTAGGPAGKVETPFSEAIDDLWEKLGEAEGVMAAEMEPDRDQPKPKDEPKEKPDSPGGGGIDENEKGPETVSDFENSKLVRVYNLLQNPNNGDSDQGKMLQRIKDEIGEREEAGTLIVEYNNDYSKIVLYKEGGEWMEPKSIDYDEEEKG